MQAGGKEKAFASVLQNPPHTTRQIMQPETYLSGEKIEPMIVPDFKHDFKDYLKFDIGAMGEFDVSVLIEQYVDKTTAKRLAPEWRGGYYYAARQKNPKPEATPTATLGLLYVSRWSNADKASDFAGIYEASLKQRYKDVNPATPVEEKANPAGSRHVWNTDEGPVIVEQQGDTVFVSESLDPVTTATLEKDVFRK